MAKLKNDIKLVVTFAEPKEKDPIKQKEEDMKVLTEYVFALMEIDENLKDKAFNGSKIYCSKCSAEIKERKDFCNTSFNPKCRECVLKEVDTEGL